MSLLDELLPPVEHDETLLEAWPLLELDCGASTHVSATSLTMYARCPEQWRRRYLLGEKEPPKGHLVWGTAHHRAAEHNYQQKIDSHEDVPVGEVEEVFAAAVDREVDAAGGESQVEWDSSKGAADVKDRGVRLARAYREQAAPFVQPVQVEQRFDVFVPGVPVPVIGYLDVVCDGRLVEMKTASRKMTEPKPQHRAQAGIYQMAAHLPVHFHVGAKTKEPGVYTPAGDPGLEVPFTPGGLERTERWVRMVCDRIVADYRRHGAVEPWLGAVAQSDNPCGWCGYRGSCGWWR